MARLNLTIPDGLYERLEQHRDRVNVSKICAAALTKELDMIAGTTTHLGNDAKVQRLVQRFLHEREIKEHWYLRGRSDGETWAVERAQLEELRRIGEDWDEGTISYCDSLDEIDRDEYPTLNVQELLMQWIRADQQSGTGAGEAADWRSYYQGWYHGARDLWKAARPSLQ